MEPQLPQVNTQPEGQPVPSVAPEQITNIQNVSPEALIDSPDIAKATEKSTIDNLGQMVPPTVNTTQQQDTTKTQDSDVSDLTPASASDSNVIEKEWITKAKSIVSKTADDPYQQQHQVSKLMAEYILKRYGRKIGENDG